MRVVFLGTKTCPHCRALVRLLEASKSNISYAYLDLEIYIKRLTETQRSQLISKFKTTPLSLPIVLIKQDNQWKFKDCGEFTQKLILRHAKESLHNNVNTGNKKDT